MINVAEQMKHLNNLAKQVTGQIRKPLWNLLTSPEWLTQAWEQIRRNKGSQTPGTNTTTAIDVDMNLINRLAQDLKAGTYRPKPVRRQVIPKANGKTRPLGIPNLEDRIVQQGLKMLLEPIFESDFLNCSHGFRQGRSTHTALRDVARAYSAISWIIEGDIEGCFDNIDHARLLSLIGSRIADGKILNLIRLFLKAGYMEDWKYHNTYSGTPQGGIISPLLANIFLNQLDKLMEDELKANLTQTKRQQNARRNREYRKVESQITILRRKLRETDEEGRKLIINELVELEKKLKLTPYYAKDKRHPCKIKYVRYADDFVILVAGNKSETEAIRDKVREKLSEIGLKLSEEKTKLTHWDKPIKFLGYNIHGRQRRKGVGIRAILSIPVEKVQKAKDEIEKVSGYYHIPEADTVRQVNAIYRGWCNYYRYANSPQPTFNDLSRYTWWKIAHFLSRKYKSSIRQTVYREKKNGRLKEVEKGSRKRNTFQITIGKKKLILDIFPPKTGNIYGIETNQDWNVDLKPVSLMSWQSGRSLATRLAALDRANGVCERCGENPIKHVHHRVPMKGRTFLARVNSDKDQKESAIALCKECHLRVHKGSYRPRKGRSGGNAGCAERCLSGVGSAVEKPITGK